MSNKKEKKKIKYPATCVSHWSTGPTNTCEEHARQLVGLGKFMGLHVAVTQLEGEAECANCKNEAK